MSRFAERACRHWVACTFLTVVWSSIPGIVSAAVSNPNLGSSPIPVGAGPRALGMGGAFSAVADDATAATWNPGGMTQLERIELGLSVGWYHHDARQENGEYDRRSEFDLDHASVVFPFHVFGCQQTIGFAWQRQFDFARDLSTLSRTVGPMSTTTQTVEVNAEGAFSSVGLSYAIELHPGLSLGATLQGWGSNLTGHSRFERDMLENNVTTLVFPSVTVANSVDEHVEQEIDEGYSAVIGLWWQAIPELTVAVVVKPTYQLRLATERDLTLTGNGQTVVLPTEHILTEFHYPISATLGLAWRHGDRNTIACDTTWTDWSRYRVVESGITTSPVNAFIPPENFADGFAIRLGYEHLMLFDNMVTAVRVGALYEEVPGAAPAPSATQLSQTHAVLDRYFGLTAGTSLCFEHLLYDLGTQVRYGRDVGTGQDAPSDSAAAVMTITVRLGIAYQF